MCDERGEGGEVVCGEAEVFEFGEGEGGGEGGGDGVVGEVEDGEEGDG